MSAALDFNYLYGFPSGLEQPQRGAPLLALATCDHDHAQPYFFDGTARHPRTLGLALHTLSDVVRTHFFIPKPALLDPVLTSNEELLRLEGFSGCCGVYARVDLPGEAFNGECKGRGTTNVDFNDPMRAALKRLRDGEDVQFSVGKDEVVLQKGNDRTIEKKVKLPLRWIKGFSEVQAYQPQLELAAEIRGADAFQFMRSLPKNHQTKTPSFAVSAGRSLRLSKRPQKGAIRIHGLHRVKVIEPLLPLAKTLRVWHSEEDGTSAWEVCFEVGSFFLMISPELYRGFSGEGQLLSNLADPPSDDVIANVRAQLKWASQIDTEKLSQTLSLAEEDIRKALGVLSTRGLAGYDVSRGIFFHRELPFNLGEVEKLQPRLKNARRLIEDGKIRLLKESNDMRVFEVAGTGTMHQVRLSNDQDECTCPWFSKHRGKRGACKHVLAAQIISDTETTD